MTRPTVALVSDRRGNVYRELINGQLVRSTPKRRSRKRERRQRPEVEKIDGGEGQK